MKDIIEESCGLG